MSSWRRLSLRMDALTEALVIASSLKPVRMLRFRSRSKSLPSFEPLRCAPAEPPTRRPSRTGGRRRHCPGPRPCRLPLERSIWARMSSPGESLKVDSSALSRLPSSDSVAVPRSCTLPLSSCRSRISLVGSVDQGEAQLGRPAGRLHPAGHELVDPRLGEIRLDANDRRRVLAERQARLERRWSR